MCGPIIEKHLAEPLDGDNAGTVYSYYEQKG